MRAAIFRGGEIVVDEIAEPRPAAGQVLVKTLACGICGSDLHARRHAHRMVELTRRFPGRKPMDLSRDVVFGHEFCCEVVDYGPGTQRKLKPGTQYGVYLGGQPVGTLRTDAKGNANGTMIGPVRAFTRPDAAPADRAAGQVLIMEGNTAPSAAAAVLAG